MATSDMFIIKRNGERQEVKFDKITVRIAKLCYGLDTKHCNPVKVAQKVVSGIYTGVTTSQLDELAAETAAYLATQHPDYSILAARIAISNLHKNTLDSFADTMGLLYNYVHHVTKKHCPLVSKEFYDIVMDNKELLERSIDYKRDYDYDFFGFKTLERAYLLRTGKKIVERPQHMLMRVAVGIHGRDLEKAIKTYNYMSQKYFTHATPTLFNAGTPRPQLASCYLLSMKSDSIGGIYDTLQNCAQISKWAGGIGLSIHDIRAKGSFVAGTNGYSNGIVPMLRVFNDTARYVDQCFVPGTLVYTPQGPTLIENIGIGDQVLTSGGTWSRVKLPVRHSYEGKVLEIDAMGIPIRVTYEHQVRVAQDHGPAQFVDARDLHIGDHIVFPRPKHIEDIDINLGDCRMYGIMLGQGYMTLDECGLSIHDLMTLGTINFIEEYLVENGVKYNKEIVDDLQVIKWTPLRFKFTKSELYGPQGNKNLNPKFSHLPLDKTLQVIYGIIESLGNFGGKDFVLDLPTEQLALGLGYQFLRLGGIAHLQDTLLTIPQIPALCKLFPTAWEGEDTEAPPVLSVPIKSIREVSYSGIVHDFEIDSPHDYVTAGLGIVHNGGGRRKGSFAIYLEPWHADIFEFLDLKKNHGNEDMRARDLFYALWVSDLFMKRVQEDSTWTLFCPNEAPGLSDVYGAEFEELYIRYEKEGLGRRTLKAQKLWYKILEAQIETGTPYMLYKDHVNRKNNQKNLGTIKSSNLCAEVTQFTSPDEVSVCNLNSINLRKFVKKDPGGTWYDFRELMETTKVVTHNLNRVIDKNYYPIPEAERSNMRHRPIGIGVQALADTFMELRYPFDSEEARQLNRDIFETIYYGAVLASMELAVMEGPYETFSGSPASKGLFQFDLWEEEPNPKLDWDWNLLRQNVKEFGLRNSLLVALMPTASTSQILGNNECFEPYTSNIYTRRVLAGEFTIVNKHLLQDLLKLGLWTEKIRNQLIANRGSIQNIVEIPSDLKALYKTVWEIKQRVIIDMAADRGAFVDQSQSMNIHMDDVNLGKLTSMHFHGWKRGLKTGMYYLRTRPKAQAIQFTVEPNPPEGGVSVPLPLEEEECLACGS